MYRDNSLNMEKRINKHIEEYLSSFKKQVCEKVASRDECIPIQDLIEFVYEYPRLTLTKEHFEKRNRVKNKISDDIRCCAKRANDERCSRRKRDGNDFCGTHSKGTPNGTIGESDAVDATINIVVEAHNIDGIIYYIDKDDNVYKTEDILMEKQNPRRIGKRRVNNSVVMIDIII